MKKKYKIKTIKKIKEIFFCFIKDKKKYKFLMSDDDDWEKWADDEKK